MSIINEICTSVDRHKKKPKDALGTLRLPFKVEQSVLLRPVIL